MPSAPWQPLQSVAYWSLPALLSAVKSEKAVSLPPELEDELLDEELLEDELLELEELDELLELEEEPVSGSCFGSPPPPQAVSIMALKAMPRNRLPGTAHKLPFLGLGPLHWFVVIPRSP